MSTNHNLKRTGAGLLAAFLWLALMTSQMTIADELPKIQFTKFTLPNGLRVVLSVDKTAPVIASIVHYHVGSKNERADRTGFAHFFEHLMFEGTDNIPRHQLDKIVQAAGGDLNAYTSFDETVYQINLPSNQLKLALWIESERMMHARVEEVGVETQRGVVKEERKNRYDNTPYGSLFEQLAKNVAVGTPYSWTPIGSAQYIDQAKIEEFRDFYKRFYVPNNAVLAIVGDIDIEKTKQLITEYFAGIPRGAEIERPKFEFPIGTKENVVEVKEDNTPLPGLIYGYRAAKKGDPDAYALEVLTTVLAGGKSSRLYREIVDKKQMAVEAQAFPFDLENGGFFGVLAIAHPTTTMDALKVELDKQIELVQKSGVTKQEFQKAMNQIETQYAGRLNGALDKAQALASYETYFSDPNLINTEIKKYQAVTLADVQRVAKKYLIPANRTILKYLVPSQGGGK